MKNKILKISNNQNRIGISVMNMSTRTSGRESQSTAQEIKRYNPITPSLRQKVLIRSKNLYKGGSEKSLSIGKKATGGRNMYGRITSYHRSGGHKKKYRILDLNRDMGVYSESVVLRIEYDPNRSANIALCQKSNGNKFYILAPKDLKTGDKLYGKYSSFTDITDLNIGQTKPLKEFPIGSIVHNLASTYARSAGTQAIVLKHTTDSTLLRLPSKVIKTFPHSVLATFGTVSNPWHNNRNLGKAGASAWIGKLPRVKGVKMNPIDHPHGGKTPVSGGLGSPARNRWARLAKWQSRKSTHITR